MRTIGFTFVFFTTERKKERQRTSGLLVLSSTTLHVPLEGILLPRSGLVDGAERSEETKRLLARPVTSSGSGCGFRWGRSCGRSKSRRRRGRDRDGRRDRRGRRRDGGSGRGDRRRRR